MSLPMYDVEIDSTEVEDFVPPDCDADELIKILEADFVDVGAIEEEEDADIAAPLRTFWDCPPLAIAGIFCALMSFVAAILFYGSLVALPLWLTGRL
jgi:hypothetical protein